MNPFNQKKAKFSIPLLDNVEECNPTQEKNNTTYNKNFEILIVISIFILIILIILLLIFLNII